jgi:transcription elongation factor GreA
MTRHPLTKAGVERLREELATLKKVDRPRIIAAIAEARAHGDLRENAEYHAAKEQQGFIEGRIQHLEYTISHAQIIDVAKLNPGDKVVFGATVTLCDEDTGEETR